MALARDPLSVTITLGDWLQVDGQMDNLNALTEHNVSSLYNPALAARARAIREMGWTVTRPVLTPILEAGRWPPTEAQTAQVITVSLSRPDWEFVVTQLRVHSHDHDALIVRLEDAIAAAAATSA